MIKKVNESYSEKLLLLAHKKAYWAIEFYRKYGFQVISENMEEILKFEPMMNEYYIRDTILMNYEMNIINNL